MNKTKVNKLLLILLGNDRKLLVQWWKSPNKHFQGKTPIFVWKNEPSGKFRIFFYVRTFLVR